KTQLAGRCRRSIGWFGRCRKAGSGEQPSLTPVEETPPWFENLGKRQVKAPKVSIRDSGMLHGLLHMASPSRLEEHPKLGASWEGFALEQVLQITPATATPISGRRPSRRSWI
ncbi:MAG TPA: DUF4143 domain-containing protein, partial [Candidatus Paceibacterota bacterium]|nr:DUF4143 domain-containing protein [Candidatus Paceibacterota bacterium]